MMKKILFIMICVAGLVPFQVQATPSLPLEVTGFYDKGVVHEPTEERLWFFGRDLTQLQNQVQWAHRCDPHLVFGVPAEVDEWFFQHEQQARSE